MAMGHALPRQADEFMRTLVAKASPTRTHFGGNASTDTGLGRLRLLAIACLQTARRLDPALRAQIEGMAQDLLPPESFDTAAVLAATGEGILDLMAKRPARTDQQAAVSVRVASLIGGREAMQFVSDLARRFDGIEDEVLRGWSQFDHLHTLTR